MSRAFLVRSAASVAAFAVAPAAAQVVPSSYRSIEHGQEAGVAGVAYSFGRGSLDLGPQLSWAASGRYSIEASGPLFFEGLAGYAPGTRRVIDPRRPEGDRAIGADDVQMLMASVRMGFSVTGRRTWRRLSPYLFASAGLAYDASEAGELDGSLDPQDRYSFGTAFTTSAGTGLRLALGQRLMLRIDGEALFWRLRTPSGFHEPDKYDGAVEPREWVAGLGVSAGLSLRF